MVNMDKEEVIAELRQLIGDYLKDQGLDLIDLIYRYEGEGLILRILVDRLEGGIRLDECTRLNNEIGRILDGKDILEKRYILEVSSPGLDRPLVTKNDFLRCIKRNVRFFLSELIDDKREIEGTIKKVEGESVYIDVKGGEFKIPLSKITKAKQIVDDI